MVLANLFIFGTRTNFVILLVYVDDIIVASPNKIIITETMHLL